MLAAPAYGLERDEISSGGPALGLLCRVMYIGRLPAFLRDHGVMTLVCESMS
jgi:hypothetical protein